MSEQEIVSQNIIMVEHTLDTMLNEVSEHLKYTQNTCVRACIGEAGAEFMGSLDLEEAKMLLTIAMRRLGEREAGF